MNTLQLEIQQPFEPHKSAQQRLNSAEEAIKAIVLMDLDDSKIKIDILRRLLYGWTQAIPKNRHATKFRSIGALGRAHEPGNFIHEHVFTRKTIANALLKKENQNKTREILDLAIACTVTIEEDRALRAEEKRAKAEKRSLVGWQRYKEAKIRVFDTIEGSELDLEKEFNSLEKKVRELM
jgi:hypothetical protein